MVDDEELIELVELELRELLSTSTSSRATTPRSSGFGAEGAGMRLRQGSCCGAASRILELMAAVDALSRAGARRGQAVPDADRGRVQISGRGTVVTGRVERGMVKVGEEVEIVGIRDDAARRCAPAWRCSARSWTRVRPATTWASACAASSATTWSAGRCGQAGSITPHTKFKAEVYVLKQGRGRPSHAVLQRLPSAVLLPDHGRDGRGDRCPKAWRW
jgi:elongation factor Tu